ncbi:MAG: carboxypeptidase-like regulatory domain-containing protein, partial [Pyrinomonadaceae bacterium]|nr:carboxypeptidase-like regulatory domain-containing protein [Pyrinomonadaceae bacterium]
MLGKKSRLIFISILVFIYSLSVIGQTNRGGITGTVTDPKGGVIPGATVTITNVGTNRKTVLTTSSEGTFSVNALDPVVYDIS